MQYTGKEQGRTHPEKETEIYYTVWDERLKRIPFSEIAFKLRTNEEAVRKQFGRAFELIIEKKYNVSFKNDDESDSCAVGLCYFLSKGII